MSALGQLYQEAEDEARGNGERYFECLGNKFSVDDCGGYNDDCGEAE